MFRWSLLLLCVAGCSKNVQDSPSMETQAPTGVRADAVKNDSAVKGLDSGEHGSSLTRRRCLTALFTHVPGWEREHYQKLSDEELVILYEARQMAIAEFDNPMWFTHPDVFRSPESNEVGVIEKFGDSTPVPMIRSGSNWRVYKVIWEIGKGGKRIPISIEDDKEFTKVFTDADRLRIEDSIFNFPEPTNSK